MELRPIDPGRLAVWRRRYRMQLGLPVIPDLHDAFCRLGRAYQIEEIGQPAGYVILSEETFMPGWGRVLPEWFMDLRQAKFAKRLLGDMLDRLRPNTLIGRTDDASGFPFLLDLGVSNQVAASLYAIDHEPDWVPDRDHEIVQSTIDDAQTLLPLYASMPVEQGGIPDEVSLMKSLAAWRHYRLQRGREVVAVCYLVPQDPPDYVTVAAIVRDRDRGQGLGRYLTAFAVRRELAEGKTVVGAVAPEASAVKGLHESLGARLAAHIVHFRLSGGTHDAVLLD